MSKNRAWLIYILSFVTDRYLDQYNCHCSSSQVWLYAFLQSGIGYGIWGIYGFGIQCCSKAL